jgi:hypothetical protein
MTTQSDSSPNFSALPPLPRLNIPEQIEDKAIADTPKIDLTPVDLDIPEVAAKPTEEQVNGIKPLLWIGLITAGLLAISFFQGTKTVSTEIQSTQPTQPQTMGAVDSSEQPTQAIATLKALPMPERDPDKARLAISLLSNLKDGKNAQDQLVEARASFHRLQNQQLSQRNPQDYALYLAGQRDKVNLALQNQVRLNQTTLVGTEDQISLASRLLIESQAITLEQIRLKVAKGEIPDIPEDLRSRLLPTAISPYVQLGLFARDSDNMATLDKMNLLADREQELARIAKQEQQNLQAAQNGTNAQPKQAKLPMPAKEVKK